MKRIFSRMTAQALALVFLSLQSAPVQAHTQPNRAPRTSLPVVSARESAAEAPHQLEQMEREKIANEIEKNLLHFSFSSMQPQLDRAAGTVPLGYWYQGLEEVVGEAPFAKEHAKKAYQYRVAGQSLAWSALGLLVGDLVWLAQAGAHGRRVSSGVAWGVSGVALAGLGADIAAIACLSAANTELGAAVRYANEATVERAMFGATKLRAGLGVGPDAAVMATLGGNY